MDGCIDIMNPFRFIHTAGKSSNCGVHHVLLRVSRISEPFSAMASPSSTCTHMSRHPLDMNLQHCKKDAPHSEMLSENAHPLLLLGEHCKRAQQQFWYDNNHWIHTPYIPNNTCTFQSTQKNGSNDNLYKCTRQESHG